MTAAGKNGAMSDHKGCDVSNGIQVGGALDIADSETFSPYTLKTGIVLLTLCAESIDTLETGIISVNGKAAIVRSGLVFRTAPLFDWWSGQQNSWRRPL